MKYTNKTLYIFLGITFAIFFVVFYLLISDQVSLSIEGFAVDSRDMLYVGKDYKIEVYKNNKLIKTIPLETSPGYAFTIENDQIIIAFGNKVYTLDSDGIIHNVYDDYLTDKYNELYIKRKEFKTENGVEYKASNLFGYYIITRMGEASETVVYRISLLDYSVKIAMFVLFILFFTFIPVLVYKNRIKSGISFSQQAENFMKVFGKK